MLDIVELKKYFRKNGTIFAYDGFLSHNLLTNIIQALDEKLSTWKVLNNSAQDVFTILIELTQNMLNYYSMQKPISGNVLDCQGILAIGIDFEKNRVYVDGGNLIHPEDADKISERIDKVAHLVKEDLKSKYRQLRKSGRDKTSKGAGLGFLEIQRKASEPIEYQFDELENEGILFSLRVYL
jgi:hypothetical protein